MGGKADYFKVHEASPQWAVLGPGRAGGPAGGDRLIMPACLSPKRLVWEADRPRPQHLVFAGGPWTISSLRMSLSHL